jgi:hemerythrin superfamily protein
MSVIDKVIAAVTPPESDEERVQARARARSLAGSSGWLAMVLAHHVEIESAFDAVEMATSAASQRAAQKQLAVILTGHSNAEESVLYPALAQLGEKAHATKAYVEQSAAKVNMAELDALEPMSQDFLDKLEHIRGAVTHHMYEEESEWFPELKEKADAATQSRLSRRYREEVERYLGAEAMAGIAEEAAAE